MKPNYTFPKTKFVKENTFVEQIIHILSEAEEFRVEATLINSNLQKVLEETVDLYHSIETLFRMCETDGIIQKTMVSVLEKNKARGYYEDDHEIDPFDRVFGIKTTDHAKTLPQEAGSTGESVLPEVIKDLIKRSDSGKVKYKTRLKTKNGRNAMVDLYQELLDACMYIKQQLMEDC